MGCVCVHTQITLLTCKSEADLALPSNIGVTEVLGGARACSVLGLVSAKKL